VLPRGALKIRGKLEAAVNRRCTARYCALRIFPNELDTGTADSAFRVDNLWCLFFNRRHLWSWRMIFRINLAMLRR
jgi:hypothetical protein